MSRHGIHFRRGEDPLSVSLRKIHEGVIATNRLGILKMLNHAGEMLTGWTHQEAHGKPLETVFDILDPDTENALGNPLLQVIREDHARELLLRDKTGKKRMILAQGSKVLDCNGSVVGFVIVFQDVSDREPNSRRLGLCQKMQAIGQLSAGIAHEINTPMQFIGDNTHFLRESYEDLIQLLRNYRDIIDCYRDGRDPGPLMERTLRMEESLDLDYIDEEIPCAIAQTLEGIQRVDELVWTLKDFSRPDLNRLKPANINQGIENMIRISRNEWKYHAEIRPDLDDNLPLVTCIMNEINQVILNLIINAAQAIGERYHDKESLEGRIWITTRHLGNKVTIKIEDNGPGIPNEKLKKIFEAFFTTKETGTGQGLAISRRIVEEKHGGTLSVESTIGLGTSFTIELPIQPARSKKAHQTA